RRIRRRRASATSRRASWATNRPSPFLAPRNKGSRVLEANPGSIVADRSSGTTCSRGAHHLPSPGPQPRHPEWLRSPPGSRRAGPRDPTEHQATILSPVRHAAPAALAGLRAPGESLARGPSRNDTDPSYTSERDSEHL